MPLYEFTCPKCKNDFEDILRASESQNPTCPHCGYTQTERKICAPSPLKTGAFPFKPGPVRPIGKGLPGGCSTCGNASCGMQTN